MIWLKARLDVAANQVAEEASEDLLIFFVPINDLAEVAFRPYFNKPGTCLFVFFASTLELYLIT